MTIPVFFFIPFFKNYFVHLSLGDGNLLLLVVKYVVKVLGRSRGTDLVIKSNLSLYVFLLGN